MSFPLPYHVWPCHSLQNSYATLPKLWTSSACIQPTAIVMGEQCSRNCSAVETQMQYCWHNTFPFEIPITTAPWIRSRAKRLGSYFNVPLKTYWASTMVLWIDRELIQLSQYIDLCEIWWCAGVNKYINILYNIIHIYIYIHCIYILERERAPYV